MRDARLSRYLIRSSSLLIPENLKSCAVLVDYVTSRSRKSVEEVTASCTDCYEPHIYSDVLAQY